ncbi:MAG: ribosomal L7Ae/L30e/S12e/Gadd45 family protein [Acidaminococcaceae bacterium]
MSMEVLKTGTKHVVGLKQTAKAIEKGNASLVFIAQDADARVSESLIATCTKAQIAYELVATMHELGKACGIHVGAATAAILKD